MSNEKNESTQNEQISEEQENGELDLQVKRTKSLKTNLKGGMAEADAYFTSYISCRSACGDVQDMTRG